MQLVQACKAPWNWENARNRTWNEEEKKSSRKKAIFQHTVRETQSGKVNFPEIDIRSVAFKRVQMSSFSWADAHLFSLKCPFNYANLHIATGFLNAYTHRRFFFVHRFHSARKH